jgi:AcrR family transcriptional regulator
MAAAGRTYGGVSGEQRQARRRAALLDAALDVVADRGVAGVTVRGVCGRAGLTDRYFYENFRDRDDLLVALGEELFGQATAALMAAIAQAPRDTVARVHAAVRTAVGWHTEDPRRGRLFLEFQLAPPLQPLRRNAIRLLADIMADQARDLLGARAPAELERSLAARTLVGGGFDLFASWLRGELDVDEEQLIRFLVAMILVTEDVSVSLDTVARRLARDDAHVYGHGSPGAE